MRSIVAATLTVTLLTAASAGRAHAQTPPPAPAAPPPAAKPVAAAPAEPPAPAPAAAAPAAAPAADDEWSERLVLETGRFDNRPPDKDAVRFTMHGEYQLRYRGQSDLRLQAPIGDASIDKLGQNQLVTHWLRLNPRFQFRDKFALVAQLDVPAGMVAGDRTVRVEAARDPMNDPKWYGVMPRHLYLEWNTPVGTVRAGQQGSYWGTGILANDGDHPTLFGDYARGAITERLMFATKPAGQDTPLTLIFAGDMVFEDPTARLLSDRDRAFQGVMAALWRTKPAEIGVYGVVRHQENDRTSTGPLTPFTEALTVGVVDVTGKFNARVPGADAFAYGGFELATIVGSTSGVRGNCSRSLDPTKSAPDEKVRSFGASATLGAVHVGRDAKKRWGKAAVEVEWGYATGDADPCDGTTKRFVMDPNHNVGLVLFRHVMAWKTARAATIAQDPDVVGRAAPGVQMLPSNGGIFGATYLNPRVVVRPRPWLDLKGGLLVAQTTADLVDPFHAGALGSYRNYDGGSSRLHDLGLELDLGVEGRIEVPGVVINLGAEGGVLFPGHAFDDDAGNRLPNQYLGNLRAGLHF
jgi:hypothetical protein